MTEEEKRLREEQEIAELKRRSMYYVPLNPSDAGLSPQKIKEHMYGGNFFNYRLIKNLRDYTEEKVESLEEEVENLKENKTAKYDVDGNEITEHYATKTELSLLDNKIETSVLSILGDVSDEIASLNASKIPKDLSGFSQASMSGASEADQSNAYLYVDNGGTPSKVPVNNLDYSKMTVVSANSENNANIREKDFLFSVEDEEENECQLSILGED